MKRGIYLTRDRDNNLWSHPIKPVRNTKYGMFFSNRISGLLQRAEDPTRFPEVTWENSPKFYMLIPEEEYKTLKSNHCG